MEFVTTPFKRACGEGIAPNPVHHALQAMLVRGERIEPTHQHVEDPFTRGLVDRDVADLTEHDVVDLACEPGQHRTLRGKGVSELGQRDTGPQRDVGQAEVVPFALRREFHQRLDDAILHR